ncbi:MAG: P-loop ATPase, Sll1717 family [Faecousia sp.]
MARDFVDILLPTESADSYYMTKQKNLVDNFIYIEPEWYSKLFETNTFYILGSKGSGKTLYAAYMCAEVRENTVSRSHTIDVGDYGKLIAMKTANHLNFTDYLTMWKVILLQKFLFGVEANEISFWGRNKNFREIQETISNYFGYDVTDDTFNPITVIDSCGKQTQVTNYLRGLLTGGITVPAASVSSNIEGKNEEQVSNTIEQKTERISMQYTDTWMRAISEFKKTIANISFNYNHYLFIDGLDVRPKGIDAKEYSECIGALVRAVYEINTKILGNMQRKDGHDFKIIALTRTDIFLNSDLVNVTSCISDNCIELDWTYSNEKEFKYSNLYRMMNRVLGWDGHSKDYPVETYFSFIIPTYSKRPISASMFIQRQSRLRPRDVIVMLRLIQRECKRRGLKNPDATIFSAPSFTSDYSKYYTEQIKSEMMFTYSSEQIKDIFQLVKTIRSDTFLESTFEKAFIKYTEQNPSFLNIFACHRDVLDTLYSLDLIGWKERYFGLPKLHWHYREVKAIDETYRMPWEQMEAAKDVQILIHKGACKHLFGNVR